MRQSSYWLFALALLGLTQGPLFAQATKDDSKGLDDPKIEVKTGPAVVPKSGEAVSQTGPEIVPPPKGPAIVPKVGPPIVPKGAIAVVPQPGISCATQGPPLRHLDAQRLIFVADEAGESTCLINNMQDLQEDAPFLKLRIQAVNWCKRDHKCHDYADHNAQLQAAARLAGWTRLIRKDCCQCQIFYVGYGAGSRVVLAAAEMLPPCTVDRVIVLASSVSAYYDLRPALQASRCGIHSFWSAEDDHLDSWAERKGTSDGAKGPAAGRVGFRLPQYCGADLNAVEAYRKLNQVRWNDDMCGNGGHCAWTLKHNLKRCVIPLFDMPPPALACLQPGLPAIGVPPIGAPAIGVPAIGVPPTGAPAVQPAQPFRVPTPMIRMQEVRD